MPVELITLRTDDDCFLDAAYWPAQGPAPRRVDAVTLLHGVTGHAFTPLMRALSEGLSAAGVAVLAINSRGHDIISRVAHVDGPLIGGAAFEDLDDAPRDLHAGVEYLHERGHTRIGLAGHSLGAVKTIYTQATAPVANAACVVALSPPRLSHTLQAEAHTGPTFLATYERAKRLVDEGRGDEPIRTETPVAAYFSAAGIVKKYGPEDRYDILRHVPSVRCPIFLLMGTREMVDMVQVGGTAAIAPRLAAAHPDFHVATIDGADHVYSRTLDAVIGAVTDWLGAPITA